MGKMLIIKGADFSQVAVDHVSPAEGTVITASPSPVGGGSVSGGGLYQPGDVATLVATAFDGYTFSGWSDGVTTPSRNVNVGYSDANYTALFVQVEIEDLTEKLVQGFFQTGKFYEGTDTSAKKKHCYAKEDSSHFIANCQNVEYYLPSGYSGRVWASDAQTNEITLVSEQDWIGTMGTNSVSNASGENIVGNDDWISASVLYAYLNVSPTDYPQIGLNITNTAGFPKTPAAMASDGVKVRRVTIID